MTPIQERKSITDIINEGKIKYLIHLIDNCLFKMILQSIE